MLALTAAALLAQNPVVSGRITDSSSAVLPGDKVQLTNAATGVTSAATSNGEGYYTLPPVQPGVYNITAGSPGFKEAASKASAWKSPRPVPSISS